MARKKPATGKSVSLYRPDSAMGRADKQQQRGAQPPSFHPPPPEFKAPRDALTSADRTVIYTTLTAKLHAISMRLNIEPFEVLLLFAAGDNEGLNLPPNTISPGMRLKAASEACKYLYPQLRSVDSGNTDPNNGAENDPALARKQQLIAELLGQDLQGARERE